MLREPRAHGSLYQVRDPRMPRHHAAVPSSAERHLRAPHRRSRTLAARHGSESLSADSLKRLLRSRHQTFLGATRLLMPVLPAEPLPPSRDAPAPTPARTQPRLAARHMAGRALLPTTNRSPCFGAAVSGAAASIYPRRSPVRAWRDGPERRPSLKLSKTARRGSRVNFMASATGSSHY
jgi:hypothetical protein